MAPQWPEKIADYIRACWARGEHSATTLADEVRRKFGFPVSRSAILGKIHRNGWNALRPVSHDPHHKPPRKRHDRPVPATSSMVVPLRAAPQPSRPLVPAPQRGSKRFFDLLPGECRWPYGEGDPAGFMFCAEPVEDARPYCGAHCRIAYHSQWTKRA